jgi:hypothetical protein
MVTANPLSHFLSRAAPHRRRRQFALGRTLAALGGQLEGQRFWQENILL